MYRSDLDTRDKSGAIAAVIAIHIALVFALLHLSGKMQGIEKQGVLRVFDVTQAPSPPPEQPVEKPKPKEKPQPQQAKRAPSEKNIKSQATEVAAPRPEISLPVPVPMEASTTPNEGVQATQGASDVVGPGTGAGGSGTGTGGGGSGSGGGGDGGYVVPPRLLTPVLRGRDFPQQLLRRWPRGAQLFLRLRIDSGGGVTQCIVDRGTGVAAIDSSVCDLVQQRFRYSPARNASGQAVAGWAGYRQVPPR